MSRARGRRLGAAALAFALLLPTGIASGQEAGPRAYGYFTGDLVEWRDSVRVPRGYRPVQRSLLRGPRLEWLELVDVTWDARDAGDASVYRFRHVYQVFRVPAGLERLEVPAPTVVFRSEANGESLEVSLRGFAFTLSPLTDSTHVAEPDWAMPPPSTRPLWSWGGSLALLLLGGGAWTIAAGRRRRRRLFWTAGRRVERAHDCREALLAVHRALEERVGGAIFAHDLDSLLDRWPPARAAREELDRFFGLSNALFYGDHGFRPPEDCRAWLVRLCARLSELEGAESAEGARADPSRDGG